MRLVESLDMAQLQHGRIILATKPIRPIKGRCPKRGDMKKTLKAIAAIALSVVLVVTAGCSGESQQGDPEAKQAALSYAEFSARTMSAVNGRDTGSDLNATFIEGWDSNGTPCEMYLIETNSGDFWLTAVAKEDSAWGGVLNDTGILSKDVSQERINSFKEKINAELAQDGSGGINAASTLEENQGQSAGAEFEMTEAEGAAGQQAMAEVERYVSKPMCENGTKYSNADTGDTVEVGVTEDGSNPCAYALTFPDGYTAVFNYLGVEGENLIFEDSGGTGLWMYWNPANGSDFTLQGSSKTSMLYAGEYVEE